MENKINIRRREKRLENIQRYAQEAEEILLVAKKYFEDNPHNKYVDLEITNKTISFRNALTDIALTKEWRLFVENIWLKPNKVRIWNTMPDKFDIFIVR